MRLFAIIVAVAVSLVAAFLFLQPIFNNIGNWGIYDWDQHMFYHESGRISLLSFSQFPLWTPYYCGGNVLLANPQSPYFSPFFAFVLLFGAVVGLKVEALVFLALGLAGTFLAARRLGCSRSASIFAAFAFMFSSWFAARMAAGHTTFFPFALLPLVFLFYLNSASAEGLAKKVRWMVAAAAVLALMFLSGGIYPFYAAVALLAFYSLLDALAAKRLAPVAAVALILALALLLSSVKLLPVLDFASGISAEKDVQLTSAKIVFKSLLSRDQSLAGNDLETGRDLVPEGRQKELAALAGKVAWGWHEYSAYAGLVPLLLAALSLVILKKTWKLMASAVFFLAVALGNYLPFGPWQLLRELPFFSSLHGPSRFMVVFVFLVSLLAAKSLSSLKVSKSDTVGIAAVTILTVIVAADLVLVSRPLLHDAFPRQPLDIKSTNLGQPEFIQMLTSAPYFSQYPNLLQGIGTLNCYERLHIKTRALPQFVDGIPYNAFIGNAYIAETNQSLNFTRFSPQRISVKLPEIGSESTLVINQNYYKGWKFSGVTKEAESFNGLLSAKVKADDSGKEVTFTFSSSAFVIGSIMTLLTLAVAALVLLKPEKAASIARKLHFYVFRQS
ncbi:hypothetical protein HYV83_01875 [Candidatus Woesearchaeota archaeon]|nr:hypothetical protein [Candidatus Woesearchaeota archaeon]